MTSFGGATPGDPLTMDPPKLIFRLAQTRVPVFLILPDVLNRQNILT